MNLAYEVYFSILANDILHAVKYYDIGPPTLLPLRRKLCGGIYRHSNPSPSVRMKPANLESYCKHASRYTT
jgi:hypothetical protein